MRQKLYWLNTLAILVALSVLSFGRVHAQTPGYIPLWLLDGTLGDSVIAQGDNGSIGIGTIPHPNAALHVVRSGWAEQWLQNSTGTGDAVRQWFIQGQDGRYGGAWSTEPNSSDLIWIRRTNGSDSEALRILNSNGNVGIGTGNPATRLHILGNETRLLLQSTQNNSFTTSQYRTDVREWHTGAGGSAAPIGLADKYFIFDLTAGATRLAIDPLGNVGIGTVTPEAKLHADAIVTGVLGTSRDFDGVRGISNAGTSNAGVRGVHNNPNGNGVIGVANNGSNAYGVWGESTSGYAGFFSGRVNVTGRFDSPDKHFKIDHPLDPANKYMVHASVESSERMNIYDGIVILDAHGEATVTMPDWFEALNRDFRYQLTSIGGFAPLFIAEEISGNRFKIAGGQPGGKVSWQVTGTRHDLYAEAHPMQVEEEKPVPERGYYLHPDLYGQPETKSIANAKSNPR